MCHRGGVSTSQGSTLVRAPSHLGHLCGAVQQQWLLGQHSMLCGSAVAAAATSAAGGLQRLLRVLAGCTPALHLHSLGVSHLQAHSSNPDINRWLQLHNSNGSFKGALSTRCPTASLPWQLPIRLPLPSSRRGFASSSSSSFAGQEGGAAAEPPRRRRRTPTESNAALRRTTVRGYGTPLMHAGTAVVQAVVVRRAHVLWAWMAAPMRAAALSCSFVTTIACTVDARRYHRRPMDAPRTAQPVALTPRCAVLCAALHGCPAGEPGSHRGCGCDEQKPVAAQEQGIPPACCAAGSMM